MQLLQPYFQESPVLILMIILLMAIITVSCLRMVKRKIVWYFLTLFTLTGSASLELLKVLR